MRTVSGLATGLGKSNHLPALDGLRGLAAVLVVLAHLPKAGLASTSPPFSGALGVMLFFILSGFLMGHLYLGKPFDRAACIRYVAARSARVLPLYYLVVIGSFILSHVLGNAFSFHINGNQFARLLLLASHQYIFWSIPPEIQFYGVFLLLWGAVHRGTFAPSLPVIACLTTLILFVRPLLPGISVFGQLQIFLTGIGVSFLRRQMVTRTIPGSALVVQVGGLLACVLVVSGMLPIRELFTTADRMNDNLAYANLPFVLVVGSVVLAFTIDTRFAHAVFANRLAERLGAWSFSLYLLHWPIMHWIAVVLAGTGLSPPAKGTLAFAAIVAAAAATHHAFELPMQKLLRPWLARLLDRVVPDSQGQTATVR